MLGVTVFTVQIPLAIDQIPNDLIAGTTKPGTLIELR